MSTQVDEDMVNISSSDAARSRANSKSLNFPFRANTVARKARSPAATEIQYQLAKASLGEASAVPASAAEQEYFPAQQGDIRRSSEDSEMSIGQPARELMSDRISKEEDQGRQEEAQEISRASRPSADLATLSEIPSREPGADNTSAALREGSSEEEIVEDQMMENPSEKKRLRREKLAEKLQDVFGLAEREEVVDEMRCWLLRSISKFIPLGLRSQLTISA
jgi:sterol 3beta-glucosyltransferase